MTTGGPGHRARRPLALTAAAAALGALLVPGCQLIPPQPEGRCDIPHSLTLASYLCFTTTRTVNPDGIWTWPATNPKTKQLKIISPGPEGSGYAARLGTADSTLPA